MAAKGGAPLAAQPRPASPGRSLGRHGGVPLTVQLSCSRARVGVRARVHGARTHGGARSPRPDYRRGLRIPGSRRILLNSFEKRGIFGPQVRGNTAEISENSESIRSMRIAVAALRPGVGGDGTVAGGGRVARGTPFRTYHRHVRGYQRQAREWRDPVW
eukprot:COSAG06_NODE_67_length_26084_cov_784.027670_3_plen_159_part_00